MLARVGGRRAPSSMVPPPTLTRLPGLSLAWPAPMSQNKGESSTKAMLMLVLCFVPSPILVAAQISFEFRAFALQFALNNVQPLE